MSYVHPLTLAYGQRPPCRCRSNSNPEWGGDIPPVTLPRPAWSTREQGISIDKCIAQTIQMLWDNGVTTMGSCCGHNRESPTVILDANADAEQAIALLRVNDGRMWKVMQWRLVTISPINL